MDGKMKSLERLREIYRTRLQERSINADEMIRSLRDTYRQRVVNVIDAIAGACVVAELVSPKGIDLSNVTPQMEEAFHLQYPHLTFDHLAHMSPDKLQGVVNGWTGKLFEVIVRDKLNNGEWVGDVHLHPGQHAILASRANQPGWDLKIVNHDGSNDQLLQLKATSSLSHIKSALEQHPDIHVIATSDVFDSGSQLSDELLHHLTNSGIADDQLRELVQHVVDHADGSGELLQALVPELPFILIFSSELNNVLRGRTRRYDALKQGISRSAKSGAVMSVVRGLEFVGASTGVTLPVSILMRLGITRVSIFNRLTSRLEGRVRELQSWYKINWLRTES